MKKVLKITALVLVVSLLSAGITVFAGGFGKQGIYPEGLTDEQKVLVAEKIDACLDELVADGEITEDQKSSIVSAIENGGKKRNGIKGERFESKREMPEMTEEQKMEMFEKHKERLAEQLEKGEITQEQYNEMLEKAENGELRPKGMGKGKPGGRDPKGKGVRPESAPEENVE